MPSPPSKADKAAAAAAKREEAARRRAEAEARKARAAEAEAAAAEAGMGCHSLQGDRGSMEDRVTAVRMPVGDVRLAGVYDGHVGEECAEFVSLHVPALVYATSEFSAGQYGAALARGLEEAHSTFLRQASLRDESGSTATVALMTGRSLYVACVGNARCVLCTAGGVAKQLTTDIKPEMLHRGLFGSDQPSAEVVEVVLDGWCMGCVQLPEGDGHRAHSAARKAGRAPICGKGPV
jgi:hypothetical protein